MTELTQKQDPAAFQLGPRRARFLRVTDFLEGPPSAMDPKLLESFERVDLAYRTLCGILFNFVPQSGHPGGSVSSGRIVESLLFRTMDYNITNPDAMEADTLCYAAGHKAMGLYAAWAVRNECVRIARPDLLPGEKMQLRLEDLLGFRRNPTQDTPLFKKFHSKALDGHPTPATPFVRIASGPSGIGDTSSFGLALGALETYGPANPPRVHVLEGEGGMTPGRVYEAIAMAATSGVRNIVYHVDWNQASIDSNRVCAEGGKPGEYVQWQPAELLYLNDWNVIWVPDGFDFRQVQAAQKLALEIESTQPTAIVYKTVKGWRYGIEGKASHGAGHAFCSEAYYNYLSTFEKEFGVQFPRFAGDKSPAAVEQNFYDSLLVIRAALEKERKVAETMAEAVAEAKKRLAARGRAPRKDLPKLSALYEDETLSPEITPPELLLKPGQSVTLRGVLGDVLNYLNKKTGGAFIGAAADLYESTSLANINKGFPAGFYHPTANPGSRLLACGGICEDGIGGVISGLSAFGSHIGVGASYGAFMAAMSHTAARVHAISQQNRALLYGDPQKTCIVVCGHAGPKTGEDGPTHADPQALQVMMENFCRGSTITLTPWDAQEMWPLVLAALRLRPALLVPYVTRPSETVVDREKLRLPPPSAAVKGLYALRRVEGKEVGTIVLQGNGVGNAFVTEVLPVLDQKGILMNVFYVASLELFDLLPEEEQERIYPESLARRAMGITEFTLATMYRWIPSREGRRRTLHPLAEGRYLGSGQASAVFHEAKIDGKGQLPKVLEYAATVGL